MKGMNWINSGTRINPSGVKGKECRNPTNPQGGLCSNTLLIILWHHVL
jgi:hypothetical protein